MANTVSAEKRIRQTKKRTVRNRQSASRLKTQVRRLKRAIEVNDASGAKDLLTPTISAIDKSVQKGVLKKNTASRLKSRLTKRVTTTASTK